MTSERRTIADQFIQQLGKARPATLGPFPQNFDASLDEVINEVSELLRTGDLKKINSSALWFTNHHGLSRSEGPDFTLEHLRLEYTILNQVLLAQVPSDRGLAIDCQLLYSEIFQMTLSYATEIFVRHSVSELLSAREEQKQSVANLVRAKTDRDSARIERDHSRESQLWLRSAIDHIPKPLFFLNLEAKDMWFSNVAARKMLGLSYENDWEVERANPMLKAFSPDGRELTLEEYPSRRALRGETINGEECIIETPTGRYHTRVFAEQLPAEHGQPRSAVVLIQDISPLKKSENELRSAQNELKKAIAIAQIGFWDMVIETNHFTASPILLNQFGLDPNVLTLPLEAAFERMHPEDRPRVRRAIELSMQNKASFHIEYRVIPAPGVLTWIEAKGTALFDETGRPISFSGTTLDITERKLAEEAIANERYQLDQIFQNSPAAMTTWLGKDMIFDRVNPGYQSLFPNRELVGKKFLEACPEYVGQGFQELLEKVLETGEPFIGHEVLAPISPSPGAPPEDRYFNFTYVQLKDAQQRPYAVYDHAVDVTETVLARKEIEKARRDAELANQAKSQFLANMSHEIRTPLGAIMGFASLLKDPSLQQEQREGFLAVIERNSAQLARIVDDILDLSKVEAGMLLIENIDFSLPEMISDFTSLMGFKAREKGIEFRSRATTPLPKTINTDPTRLRQILTNVVGNAIKFTEQGSVEMRCSYGDGFLEFEVQDTGRGLTEEESSALFQPFVQADSSITRKYGGTGLGLTLSRALSEALGGNFTLRSSEYGKGSTFCVRVRAESLDHNQSSQDLALEAAEVKAAPDRGELAGLNILLVEDSPDNQALLSIFLGRAGARTDIASDGAQGCKMALMKKYDVILMDVQMPVMDGMTAIKKLRSENYQGTVIALTAHAMREEKVRCLNAGFDDFLSKPVTREDLIRMLSKYRPSQTDASLS